MADGHRVLVVVLTNRHFADLGKVTGLAGTLTAVEAAVGGDFGTDAGRYEHREVICGLLAPWFAARTIDEVEAALGETSLLWQRYRSFADVAADPAVAANPLMRRIDQPGVGPVTVPGMPLVQPGLPDVAPAPALGEDREAVLGAPAMGRNGSS